MVCAVPSAARLLLRQQRQQNPFSHNNLPISLELCDSAKLARYLSEHTLISHSLGATMSTTYLQNGQAVHTEVRGVAVLHGLPSTLFQGVTIHELGHVWLIVQGISNLPAWAEEGFCELLSYRYYTQANTPESRYRASAIEQVFNAYMLLQSQWVFRASLKFCKRQNACPQFQRRKEKRLLC